MTKAVDQEAVAPAPKSPWAGVLQGVFVAVMIVGLGIALFRSPQVPAEPEPDKPAGIQAQWIANDTTDPEGPGLHNIRVQSGWVVFSRAWGVYVPERLQTPKPLPAAVAPVVSGQ